MSDFIVFYIQNITLFVITTLKHDKFKLTDEELKKLLLVSSVIRGLRVKNTENGEYDETVTCIERTTSQKTHQLNEDDTSQ